MNLQIRTAYTHNNYILLLTFKEKKRKELQTAVSHLNFHKMKAMKMSFEISPKIYLFGAVCQAGHFLAMPKKN